MANIIKTSQGRATRVLNGSTEDKKDKFGITQPNLHRRVNTDSSVPDGEVEPRDYDLGVYGTHSYRAITVHTHDEESGANEIP